MIQEFLRETLENKSIYWFSSDLWYFDITILPSVIDNFKEDEFILYWITINYL